MEHHQRSLVYNVMTYNSYYMKTLVVILFTFVGCIASKKATMSKVEINIIPRSAWDAASPRPYSQHIPDRITIHHEGTRLEVTDDAAKKIKNIQSWGMGPDRKWTDIPYHFLIAPNGVIYEGRVVTTVGETATEYDPTNHLLIVCLGNLEEQEVTQEQLSSLINLVAFCCKKFSISYETIATHKDFSRQTTCPGKNLYKYFANGEIKNRVRQLIQ